jgi:arylsulfatase
MLIEGSTPVQEIKTMDEQAQLTTKYTEHAVAFIEKHKKQPFFLYMPQSMPHVPIAASDKFKGKSEQGVFGDVLMEIDWSVGEVMKALEKNGLTKNTIIIFTSDNGPWLNFGNHAGSAGGLREGKGTSWDGGQKVPCIMRWPGQIPAGNVCNRIASTIDILPTLATITKASMPTKKIDGVNILPLMMGDKEANPREVFLYYFHAGWLEGVRKNQWKLVLPHKSQTYEGVIPGKDGSGGPSRQGVMVPLALYDLRRDPGERYDVQEQNPEVVAELLKIADEARKDLGDGIHDIKGAYVREPGKVK